MCIIYSVSLLLDRIHEFDSTWCYKPGRTCPSLQDPSTTIQPDPQSWTLETQHLQKTAGKKTKNHKLQFRKKKNNNNWRENMTRLLAYRALVFLLKDPTCAAQVDTRALILFRCISMVSLSVICSVRHNSRTTWNKILLIKKTLTKSNYSRDSPGLEQARLNKAANSQHTTFPWLL